MMIRDALAPTSFTNIMCIFTSCCLTPSSVLLYSYFLTDAKFKVIPLEKKKAYLFLHLLLSVNGGEYDHKHGTHVYMYGIV